MEEAMTAISTRATVALPAPGPWVIDPGHVEVGFVGRHFGLTRIRGRFNRVEGVVTIGEHVTDSFVQVSIDTRSLSSGDQTRDDHLRSADFFDVEHHPTATYRSTALAVSGTSATMVGELTIKGVTRPVHLQVDFLGGTIDPWGNERAVFSARGKVNREEWGLTWNMVLEAGGLLVSKEIVLEVEVELVRPRREPRT
jgi:polyisoprenoid-binding protein YceI